MPASKIITGQKIAARKLERARQLRREMTPAERLLWQQLRRNQLGRHFRRQQIIAGFIVDFFCQVADLVIEVDGGIHREQEQKAGDARRQQALEDMGLHIVRFKNEEVLTDLPHVVERIRKAVEEPTT